MDIKAGEEHVRSEARDWRERALKAQAEIKLLRAIVDAAGAMREDCERYGYVSNKGYVNHLHDEKILRAYDDALDKLREWCDGAN